MLLDISGDQLRAARSLVGLTTRALAAVACVNHSTVIRLEGARGKHAKNSTLAKVIFALRQHGVEFVPNGVVLRSEQEAK
jgi:hypothetical protein